MSIMLKNTSPLYKSIQFDLSLCGLYTLPVLRHILSTSIMSKQITPKKQQISFINQWTCSTKRCISIFMSSVRMFHSPNTHYQVNLVLT